MAFRNPVRSIPASGIIGLIGGTQLAADSINGKTIIGATIETAAGGTSRILMGPPAYLNSSPAILWDPNGTGPDWHHPCLFIEPTDGHFEIDGPYVLAAGGRLTIWPKVGANPATIQLEADGASALGWLFIDGDVGKTVIGGDLHVNGQINMKGPALPYVDSGTYVAAPDAAGHITIPYNVTFAAAPWPVPGSGSGALQFQVDLPTTTNFRVTVYGPTGIVLTSGLRRIDWIAVGSLP